MPTAAQEDAEISLTATGSIVVTRTLRITPLDEEPELLGCSYPSRQGTPGGVVDFSVQVSNPSYFDSEARLSLKGLPAGWGSMILNSEGEWIASVYLPSGGSDGVTIRVEIPQTAGGGLYDFEVEVVCGGLVDSTTLGVEVEQRVLTVGLKTRYPFQMVELGEEVSFPITLENPGETDEAISLSSKQLPEGWRVGFTNEMGAYIQSVLLEARGEEAIIVVVKPAADAGPGNYGIRVEAKSQNLEGSLLLTVGLMGSTDMKLKVPNLYDKLTVGETKTIRVWVENTGYSPPEHGGA